MENSNIENEKEIGQEEKEKKDNNNNEIKDEKKENDNNEIKKKEEEKKEKENDNNEIKEEEKENNNNEIKTEEEEKKEKENDNNEIKAEEKENNNEIKTEEEEKTVNENKNEIIENGNQKISEINTNIKTHKRNYEEEKNNEGEEEENHLRKQIMMNEANKRKTESRLRELEKKYNDLFNNIVTHWENDKENFLSFYNKEVNPAIWNMLQQPCIVCNQFPVILTFKFLYKYFDFFKDKLKETPFELILILYYFSYSNIFSLEPKINNNNNNNYNNIFDESNELINDKLFYYLFKELLPNEEIENSKLGHGFNCMMKYLLESLLKSGFFGNLVNDFLTRDDINIQNYVFIIYFCFIVLRDCEENFVKKHNYNIILINQFTKKMKIYLAEASNELKNNKDKFYSFLEHIRKIYFFIIIPSLSYVLDDYIKDNKEEQIKEFLFSIYNFFEFLLKQQKLENRIFAIDKLSNLANDYKYYNKLYRLYYNEPEKIFEYTKKVFISFLVKINIFDLVCGENIHEALIERFYAILSLLYKNNSFTPEQISSLWKICQSKYQSISNSIISLFGKLLPEFSIEDCNTILNTILSMNFNEVNEVTLKLLENFFLSEHRHQNLLNILFKYSNELSFYKGLSSNIIDRSRNILIKLLFNKKYSIDLIQCINNCLFGLDNYYLLNTNKDIFIKIMNEFSKNENMSKNIEIFKIINENIDNFGIFVSYLDEQYSIFWILLNHIFYVKKLLIFFTEEVINLKKLSKKDNFDVDSVLNEDKLLLKYKEYEKANNKENNINNENEINKNGNDIENNKKTNINCLLPTSRKDIDDYLKYIIKDFIFFVKNKILKKDDISDTEIINEFFSKFEFSFEKKVYKSILTQIIDSIFIFHEKGNIYIKKDIFDFLYKLLVENCVHNDEREIFYDFIKSIFAYQFNNLALSIVTDENMEYLCLEKIASSEITLLPYSAYEAFILYLIYINEKNGNINYSHSTNKFIDIKKIDLLIGFKTLLEFYLFCNNVKIAINSLGNLTNIIEVASCDMLNRKYILDELFSLLEKYKIKIKENINNAKSKIALRRLLRLISVVNRTKVKKNLYDKNDPNNFLELNINNNFFNNNEENNFTYFKAFKGLTVKEFKEELIDKILCESEQNIFYFNSLNIFPQYNISSFIEMKNLIINYNLITLYYNDQILKDEFTLADYDMKSGENILILNCMPTQNEQEFSMTEEQLKEGYEQIKVVFNDKFNEEIMKEALYKHKGDIQNAIIYMTEESNVMELLKEIEIKKNVPQKKEELICLEVEKFNLLLDILNEDDNDINDSVWDLFSEIKFQEEFIINSIEKDFDKINEEKNLNKKILILKIINSVIFDDNKFCKNNKVTKAIKNKWISKFINNENFVVQILTFLSNIKMEKASELNYSKILEIFINLLKNIISKIVNLNINISESVINTNSKENENPNENHENLNINAIIDDKAKKEEEEKDIYGEYTIEGKEGDNFMNILSKNNFVSFIYNILGVVLQLSKVQTKATKKSIIKNIYDFLIEFLQMFPNDVKQFLEEENKSKIILKILTSEKEAEIRISTLNFVKKLIETLKIKQNEENKIDIRTSLLNYYYPQLISDEVYCEEFYALYHYLFNIESLKPKDIQIDKIIEKFFDYLYDFYINNHNIEKEEEKSDQIKNKLNYNLYILTSFTPLYNDLLKKELEKKMEEKKDIITLLYNCLFKIENEENSNINYLFSDEQLRNNSFNLLENLISLNKKYYLIILPKFILHHRGISQKKSDLPLSYPLRDIKSQKFLGLKNLGATCYLNSLFQQMFMIPTLQNDIFSFNIIDNPEYKDKNDLKYSTIYNMQVSFASLKNSIMSFYPPISFINSFKTAFNGEPIHLGVQQDTDEFLAILCEELEKEGKKFGKENFLENSFKGKITNEIVSLEKEYPYYSQTEEPFNRITLDIKGHKNLEDALDAYVKGEILEGENQYYVEKYKKKISIKKRTSLKKIGNQIIIHLKRFEFDFVMFQNNKLNDYLKFPLKLNLKRWTRVFLRKNEVNDIDDNSISEEEKENLDDEKMNYELTGILIHSGSSLQSGHYYSFIKDQETDKWYKFNDSSISDYNIDTDLEKECFGNINNKINQYGKGAYLLFYTKKECIEKNKDYNQKIKINEKILKEVQRENADFLNLKTFASEIYHKFFIKFIYYSLNYSQNEKKDIEENDTNYTKTDYKYDLLIFDELKRDVEIYKKVLLKLKENKENKIEINEEENEIKVLPDNIDEIYEKCVSEYNDEENKENLNVENVNLDKILNLFCYYFFGIVIQYNDKEANVKECISLLKEILNLSDSYSVNIMKIIEKYSDIFVDLLFKYGFVDKDMTGINQYIFEMYKILFHSIWIFEKNKYGFITPETYIHFVKDEKGKLIQVKSHKSLFLRIFKKIFCDNLEKCRKEYSRDSLFLNLYIIITVACPESCLVSCNILLQLPSFISNNNLAEYKSTINPNLKMANPPNSLYSSIFYEIIIRCATPWTIKNREESPYMMLKYPQGIKNIDLSFYPKLPNDWEKILTREFFLEYILSNNIINTKNILHHICYEDENISIKIMKLVNKYLKQPYYAFFEKEDIFLNTFEIFELNDSLTDKRLNALFELEEKEDQNTESLVEFYIRIKNQMPILVLDMLYLFSKALEKHIKIFDYFKKNKNKFEWVNAYYISFFDDKGNLPQNVTNILNKHPDLFQVIEFQFINRLEV